MKVSPTRSQHQIQTTPLDYAECMSLPSPGRRRIVTLLAGFPWILLLFEFMLVLPRYDKLFRQHGLKVPSHTDFLLSVALWVEHHVLAAFLIAFALIGVSFGLAHTAQSTDMSRRRRFLILLVVFGLPCLLFILAWVGVESTYRTLVEGLQR